MAQQGDDMRKTLAILLAVILPALALAGPQYIPFEVANGVATNVAQTDTQYPIGYIDEIYIQHATTNGVAVVAGIVTSTVTVVSAPNVGSGLTSTTLFTDAAVAATALARPRVVQTDNTGTDLTSLTVAERFLCNGDPVTLTVTQVTELTNLVYKAWIKIDAR